MDPELRELLEAYRSFVREWECFGGEYYDPDEEELCEWRSENVPEHLLDEFYNSI